MSLTDYSDYILLAHASALDHFAAFRASLSGSTFGDRSFLDEELKNSLDPTIQVRPFPWDMLLIITVYLLAIHWSYRLLIVKPLSRVILSSVATRKSAALKRVPRLTQAHIELINYSIFAYLGTVVVINQPWAFYFDGKYKFSVYWFSNQPNPWIFGKDIIFYYVLYAARYLQAFISVLLESKKKDFWEMQLHHAVTFGLVIVSFYNGRLKGGLITMVIMDYADPPLHLGKHFVYIRDVSSGLTNKVFGFISDISFVIFIIVFFATRLCMYPYMVWTTMQANYNLFIQDPHAHLLTYHGLTTLVIDIIGFEEALLLVLMTIMIGLQVFWMVMIIKQAVSVLSGNDVGDQRSESESEANEKKNQ